MSDVFSINQEVIRQRWPVLWPLLASSDTAPISLEIVEGHVATLRTGDLDLGSRYDPVAEAATQIESVPESTREVWLYGVGMGYVPRLLLERDSLIKLHIVILSPAVFYSTLHYVDQTGWLKNHRVELLLGRDERELHTPFCVIPPLLDLVEDNAARLRDLLVLELNTPFIQEHRENKAGILTEKIAAVSDIYESDAAVSEIHDVSINEAFVVGAGPSLDSQIDTIRAKRDSAVLIAVDAALRPLLTAGLVPDYVVTIDDADHNIEKYFKGDLSPVQDTVLVYFPVVSRHVLENWPAKRMVAYGDSLIYEPVANFYPGANLFSSGSVFHVAVDLAVNMHPSRVTLFGADFSFPGDRYYAASVSREVRPEDYGRKNCWVFNGRGEKVSSQRNLIGYLRDLERYIAEHPEVEFINAGHEGAMIEGANCLDF